MGIALFDPLNHCLLSGHTAGEKNQLLRVAAAGMGQSAQISKHPLLRMLPHRTGIDNDQVGPLRLLLGMIAHLDEHPQHPLAVCLILLAAIGVQPRRGLDAPGCPVGLHLIGILLLDLKLFF